MERKSKKGRLSFGILYFLTAVILDNSLVEASTPQQECEAGCSMICSSLFPPFPQSGINLEADVIGLIQALPNDMPARQKIIAFYNAVTWKNPQSLYTLLLGSYPASLTALCGTTPGQTNCATACTPSNMGQKVAPQVKAPAPKAAPTKK